MLEEELSFWARSIAEQKDYMQEKGDGSRESWEEVGKRVAENVLGSVGADKQLIAEVVEAIARREFMPGGRYLYGAGRPFHQTQNCFVLFVEDSREGWADLLQKATMALMSGGGIGVVYSHLREEGAPIRKTGGKSTGPIALMQMVNEAGRHIMQGGSRRCLPAGTKVLMADFSEKPIESIKVGDLVHTRFGPRKVTAFMDQGRQEILEITTERGTVYSSRKHRWLAAGPSRSKTFKITAENLDLNSKLYRLHKPRTGGEIFDEEIAYLIGYYLGDGCAYSSGRTHEVTLQVAKPGHNQELVTRLITGMKKLTGVEGTTRMGHGEVTEIRVRSKEAVNLFQKFKKPHEAFRIPSVIENASLSARRAFIAGWFDADGYYGADSWKLSNKHASVRREMIRFMADLGFEATESGHEVRLNSYQSPSWEKEVLPFSDKKPRPRFFSRKTSEIPSKIIGIRTAGEAQTYDIEVEDVHEFVADGFVTHNSAIWAGLHWNHPDVIKFINMKNWSDDVKALKAKDYNFPAPMDMTNISVILDDEFFSAYYDSEHPKHNHAHAIYWLVIEQMCKTGEPGFSIDVGENAGEHGRNACTEFTSHDDSDVCNLGSINMAKVKSLEHFRKLVRLGAAFLLAGTVYSDVPYAKVDQVRGRNRKIGLGLMGIHEWLLKQGFKYGMNGELEKYLGIYKEADVYAKEFADKWRLSRPKKTRSIAPTGTIGIVAETTTGIEPIFCVAYKRRYLKGNDWHYQYVIDPTAKRLIEEGVNPEAIEDAYSIDVERRVAFQAAIQEYVDMAISSTINLPHWGSASNNQSTLQPFGEMLLEYLPLLRGITVYPDGSRSGQPLQPVKYSTAIKHQDEVFVEYGDVCDITKGGSCNS